MRRTRPVVRLGGRSGPGSSGLALFVARYRLAAADLPLLVLSLEGVTLPAGPKTLVANAMTPASMGGRHLRKNPAATYSPRGSTPKYHRRGRA